MSLFTLFFCYIERNNIAQGMYDIILWWYIYIYTNRALWKETERKIFKENFFYFFVAMIFDTFFWLCMKWIFSTFFFFRLTWYDARLSFLRGICGSYTNPKLRIFYFFGKIRKSWNVTWIFLFHFTLYFKDISSFTYGKEELNWKD